MTISVTLGATVGQACVFRNDFVPIGRIILRLKTIGGTATGVFLGLGPGESMYDTLRGTTRASSVPVGIFNKGHLPFGTWLAYSLVPVSNPANGIWKFQSYVCSTGVSTEPVPQLRVVRLSAAHPLATCLATYVFVPAVHPTPTPTLTPVPVTGRETTQSGAADHFRFGGEDAGSDADAEQQYAGV